MIALKKVESLGRGLLQAAYQVTHGTAGRTGTVLEQNLEMRVDGSKVTCRLAIEDCEGATPEEALERMAGWCERMAAGIRERPKPVVSLPVS